MDMSRIGIITSSTRPARIGHVVGAWVADQRPDGTEVDLVDLGELDLPFFADERKPREGAYDRPSTKAWSDRVKGFDAVVFVVAEYNGSFTAPLKNAIDTLYAEWVDIPVAMVGYGFGGAGSALSHLTDVLNRIKMNIVTESAPQLFFNKTVALDGQVLEGAPDLTELYEALLAAPAAAAA